MQGDLSAPPLFRVDRRLVCLGTDVWLRVEQWSYRSILVAATSIDLLSIVVPCIDATGVAIDGCDDECDPCYGGHD